MANINWTQLGITVLVVGIMQLVLSSAPCTAESKSRQATVGWVFIVAALVLLLWTHRQVQKTRTGNGATVVTGTAVSR